MMTVDPAALAVAELGVFLIAFMRGAFGGGFAIIGIPLLSIAMDPIQAGGLLAPLFIAMDVVALRYWRPATWSLPDLAMLVPPLLAGVAVGYYALDGLDHRAVAIAMAVLTLGFAAQWFIGGARVTVRPRSLWRATAAGGAAGITTMVAHSGGPPLAVYLLSLGLPKALYAGTTSLFFTVANAAKVGPWLLLAGIDRALLDLIALCLPAVPLGVWVGWRLHQRLDQHQLYRACYGLLVVTALKLLWDGVRGYL
jgi:uncharacterized membrane protein YfcA